MRFGVLGPLAVWDAHGTAIRVPGVKVRTLLADLLAHAGRPVPADRLIDDLWGDDPPGNPAGALQAKVSQLRRALDGVEPGARRLVEWRAPGYLLRVADEAIDAGRFALLTAQARDSADPKTRSTLLGEALALFRGPAYADFADEEFARGQITRLEEQRVTALEDLAEARLELGEYRSLAGELDALVERYPLRERLRAAHIRALYQSGRQGEALASYERLRVQLRTELGLDPGTELVQLQGAILRQDPALRPAPAPRGATASPRTNLPAPLLAGPRGGLVGRERDIAEVRTRLQDGRLVTLTGPGGVGKTRLAIETAAQVAGEFPDGTWLVELATRRRATNTVETLADAVLAALGIREDAALGRAAGWEYLGLVDRLTSALRAKRLLLILDNCEHVVDSAAELARVLLESAPGVRVLATGQEPLALSGELLHPVQPLELPALDADPQALARNASVRLFVARAAEATPGFTLDPEDAPAVASICRRLDGIPLALELAATRVRVLGVRGLAARLHDRFRLLTTGHRDAPARQRTLRAMIDWSWELLPPPERAVLRRLAVHADGCALEAAEEVCAGGDVASGDILDLLGRLVDRSLVTVTETAASDTSVPGGPGTGPRYHLLESVAAYGLERLDEAGETGWARRQHAEYYTRLAERAEPQLRGHDQQGWLDRLDAEAANLRAALDTAARLGEAPLALRLVNALAWYRILRGRYEEARRSLRAALDLAGAAPSPARAEAAAWLAGIALLTYDDTDPVEQARAALEAYDRFDDPDGRARAEWLLAFARLGSGDLPGSQTLVEEALATFQRNGDRWGIAAALSTRAETALVRGDLAAARHDSETSDALFRELGDRWGQVHAAQTRGILAEITGDYALATRVYGNALRMAEELRLWPSVAAQTAKLGRLALLAGDFAEAERLHERARELAAEQGDGSSEAFALTGLALAARRQGRLDTAETYLRELLAWNRRTGYQPGAALALAELGFVAERRGDAEAAAALHSEGLAVARETGDIRSVALALEGMAGVATLTGDHGRAARLLGTATAARESVGVPLPPAERGDVDRLVAACREALGDEAFDAEFARGSATPPQEASLG